MQNKELHIVPPSPGKGDTREARLLSLLKNNPSTKTEELAKELGVSLRTIKSVIATLVKEGKLERVGGKKYGHWGVKKG
ncbi:MAG: HTH domain-containing protein [Bacilli bacterium]|nr:HTH domain-containing protein [Bacilli bacterium]